MRDPYDRLDALTFREAADQLDELWELEADRGSRDSLGSAEYRRLSLAPVLRRLSDRIDPPSSGDDRVADISVADAIFALDDGRALELTGEEVDRIADVGLDAFDRGLCGRDIEAVVAAATDQVVATRERTEG